MSAHSGSTSVVKRGSASRRTSVNVSAVDGFISGIPAALARVHSPDLDVAEINRQALRVARSRKKH